MTETPEKRIAHINIYGMAQCGPHGSLLDGNPIDTIAISSRLLGFSALEAFAVKARGESMSPHIKQGDIVIAKRVTEYSDGDIVVCSNDGEALIKQVVLKGGQIILNSFNDDEEFRPFPASKDDFKVEGVVKGVMSYAFK